MWVQGKVDQNFIKQLIVTFVTCHAHYRQTYLLRRDVTRMSGEIQWQIPTFSKHDSKIILSSAFLLPLKTVSKVTAGLDTAQRLSKKPKRVVLQYESSQYLHSTKIIINPT